MLEALQAKDELNSVIKTRVEKACLLLDENIDLYPNDFRRDNEIDAILKEHGGTDGEVLEKTDFEFTIAGRVVSYRSFGKVTFFHMQDRGGKIQVYAARDELGTEAYQLFKKTDIGDIVGVTGCLFRTKTGELTIKTQKFRLLTKSMRPLPEKYHGLKDVETRYRQRYVDLIVTPKTKEIFKARTAIIRELRDILDEKGFMEVETPMMQAIPGGATAKPFETHHNALDMKLYMRIAPELYLKRLLVGGFERVYEINRNFRNEGTSTQHNPEFTMLEFYWAYATFEDLMDLTEEMFSRIAEKVTGSPVVPYQGAQIDLSVGAWTRMPFHESLEKIGGVPAEVYADYDKCSALVKEKGEKVVTGEKLGKLQAKLFDILVEPKLVQPHFIYHYPTDISPLSRRNENNPDITDRFELFMTGRELANAFSELNDPVDQRGRFAIQVEEKEAGDEEAHFMDEDYVRALEYGMPPAAGQGIGIDRLVMLLTDSASIREVILFPLLRPEAG
ncbi:MULTISPECIES: lysine--tRNA ligase [unclassified Pseudodesulfovibrio]|uniref:lysine--tRNA ligase n=1 Tax=unclassified Pseudodesulfovibrio TaxID=2661612 RepID=UPI000FEBD48E|nr:MULTISPECIES: lysine--tRNA ligase [unclassified Pseudodesulfovibrio]MCJ2163994.1 lysine--tRNA ligase [Pseudodesulfovibrio sp. S3-i]RWU05402.1 lysine--tRNA ligase [Pseudodesulfovibrio sp. S3]